MPKSFSGGTLMRKKYLLCRVGAFLVVLTLLAATPANAWNWPWEDDWYPCQGTVNNSCNLWDYGWACCGDLTCDLLAGAICRHDPPWLGEQCSADLYNLGDGICKDPDKNYCKGFKGEGLAGICTAYSKVGESCDGFEKLCGNILGNTGRMCRPLSRIGGGGFDLVCYPNWLGTDVFAGGFIPENPVQCLEAWSESVHDDVIADAETSGSEIARAYSSGFTAYVAGTYAHEVGVAYGSDGSYACYRSNCYGLTSDAGGESFVSYSEFFSFEDFEAGFLVADYSISLVLGGSAANIYKHDDPDLLNLAGRQTTVSLGIGESLVAGSVLYCDTDISWKYQRTPYGGLEPVALPPSLQCRDTSVCAGADSCTAQASVSQTPGAEPVPVMQIPGGPYVIGSREVTLTPASGGAADACTATLEVNDCTPPQILCPAPLTAECQSAGTAVVPPGTPTVEDCSWYDVFTPENESYPLGTTTVSYMAVDQASNAAKCDTTVTVVDTLPPEIRSLTATPSLLWPPNHKMRTVRLDVTAEDACGSVAACTITGITSDDGIDEHRWPGRRAHQPFGHENRDRHDGGRGDRHTDSPDVVIVNDTTVRLRAERSGSREGRTYSIWVECLDATAGNSSLSSVNVVVPHDRSKKR